MFRIALHACCTFLWFSGDLELLMSSQSSTLSSHPLKTLDHVISSPNGVHGRASPHITIRPRLQMTTRPRGRAPSQFTTRVLSATIISKHSIASPGNNSTHHSTSWSSTLFFSHWTGCSISTPHSHLITSFRVFSDLNSTRH
ncbi:unnamed protein product [Arabidopsis halleri]